MPLDNSSLYIITKPLLHGYFHWALLVVDERGITTRHKWAQDESITCYTHTQEEVDTVMGFPPFALLYAKVQGYKPDQVAVAEVCREASTAQPQGQHATASQTWVRSVLCDLEVQGSIRMDGGVAEVENRVARWSMEQELLYLEGFMKGEVYLPAVERL